MGHGDPEGVPAVHPGGEGSVDSGEGALPALHKAPRCLYQRVEQGPIFPDEGDCTALRFFYVQAGDLETEKPRSAPLQPASPQKLTLGF